MKTSIPLYHRLKNDLIHDIQTSKWAPGDKIPSEAELANQHGVSRITVRQAVSDLVSMGYLVRHQGKGTFVARQRQAPARSKLQGFTEELRSSGLDVMLQVKTVEMVACSEKIGRQLDVRPQTPLIQIRRIATVDGVPLFRDTSYLVPPTQHIFGELTENAQLPNHIYGFFEQHGVKIAFGSQQISAERPTQEDVVELEIPLEEPILVIYRVTSDDTGRPVEFSEVRYPSSRYTYSVNLTRGE